MNEVGALAEELPTLTALIRLFSSVNPLMLNKIRTSTKEFATLAAHVRAFTSVNSLMFDETGALAEEFPTFTTLIRLSLIMISLVLKEASSIAEEYPTFVALIRPFSSVGSLLNKRKFVTESILKFTVHLMELHSGKIHHTFRALLWLPHTGSDMMLEKTTSVHKGLPILPECKRYLWNVISAALHKQGPAFIPSNRLLHVLLHLWLAKVGIELELFPMCLMHVWFLLGMCCLMFSQMQNVFQV